MKRWKLRMPNRWQMAIALMVTVCLFAIVWFRVMKICGERHGEYGAYCSLDETLGWLRSGGNWELWIYLIVLVIAALVTYIEREEA